MSDALTGKHGRVWIQPGGPNQDVYMLSCVDLGDLTEPMGSIDLLRCYNPLGKHEVVGQIESPPDPITTTVTGLIFPEREAIETLECSFGLYVLMADCGRQDNFLNYRRGQIVANARLAQRTFSGLVVREEDAEATYAVDVEGYPPLLDVDALEERALTGIGAEDVNDIVANDYEICEGACGLDALGKGQLVIAVADAPGAATAHVYVSVDYGVTFAATAADPFAVGEDIIAVQMALVGRNTTRIIVGQLAVGGAQGLIAYSDDMGASWTTVNIGGAAAGDGCTWGGGLKVIGTNVWLASANGYIYYSDDSGETWVAQEAGNITAGDYSQVDFADESLGIAGAAGDVIAITEDGGVTWYAASATGGGNNITTVSRITSTFMWAGDDGGELYYSHDGGTTWAQRTGWTGSGTGAIQDIHFVSAYEGYMIHNTVAPVGSVLRTFSGGRYWEVLDLESNSGFTSVFGVTGSLAYVAGLVHGGAGRVGKVRAISG